jgi:RNA polymerase sigma factor (TIGR02999 family)
MTAQESLAERVSVTPAPKQCSDTLPNMLPLVYHDLRRYGRSLIRAERPGHTLPPTAILNEALVRLLGVDTELHDRQHCFSLVALTMRRVLIDHAKAKRRLKREQLTAGAIETLTDVPFKTGTTPIDMVDVDMALSQLAILSSQAAEMIQLRYFFGVEDSELAALFDMSLASVERTLRFSKAWLCKYLQTQDL